MFKFDNLTSDKNYLEKDVLDFAKDERGIPKELEYKDIGGQMAIVSTGEDSSFRVNAKIDENIIEKVGGDRTKFSEYMYNAQRPIGVNEIFVGDYLISKNDFIISPFKNFKLTEAYILPQQFSKDDYWESYVYICNKRFKVKFVRSAYDGIGVRRYIGNVNNEFDLTLEFFDNKRFNGKISFKIEKVKTISQMLSIGNYIKNIDTLRINKLNLGLKMSSFQNEIFEVIEFWEKVQVLNKTLGKRFKYTTEILQSDFDEVNRLYTSLIENRFFVSDNNNDNLILHVKGNVKNDSIVESDSNICLVFEFEERVKLLGQNILLYKEKIIINYRFKRFIEDVDEDIKVKMEIEKNDNSLIIERNFLDKEKRDKVHLEITSSHLDLDKIVKSSKIMPVIGY